MAKKEVTAGNRPVKKGRVQPTSARAMAQRKKGMLEAMRKTLGNVSQSVKMVGISRQTYYRWIENDRKFAEQVEEVTEYTYDFVESKIMKQIQENNVTMIIFFAKTKMKSRGYIERQEIAVTDRPVFVVDEKTKEDAKGIMDVIHKHNKHASG